MDVSSDEASLTSDGSLTALDFVGCCCCCFGLESVDEVAAELFPAEVLDLFGVLGALVCCLICSCCLTT